MVHENLRNHQVPAGGPETQETKSQQGRHGCHSNEEVRLLLDNLTGLIFGSCASVVEVASNLVVPDNWQDNTKSSRSTRKKSRHLDPRFAGLVGRYQSKSINPQELAEGIPSFLESEDMEYSFEEHAVFDDNISALSAYTLEEMAIKNGHLTVPVWGKRCKTPSITRTNSSSSSSREHKGPTEFKSKGQTLQSPRSPKTRR